MHQKVKDKLIKGERDGEVNRYLIKQLLQHVNCGV